MRVLTQLALFAVTPLFACKEKSTEPTAGGPLRIEWHTRLPFSGQNFWLGRPGYDAGRVFVQDGNLTLALDAATGRTLWNFRPDSQAVVLPALDEAALYTGQRGIPVVYAIGTADGRLRWRTDVGVGYQYLGHVRGVTVSGDTVYATVTRELNPAGGLSHGVLVALDRRDGRELWRWETPDGVHNFVQEPLIAGRLVVVSDIAGMALHAIDPATRQPAWRAAFANNAGTRILLDGGTIYMTGTSGIAVAVDATRGAIRWSTPGYSTSTGGTMCAASFFMNDANVVRFDRATGKQTGRVFDPGQANIFTSDMNTDGRGVFVTGYGGVYRISC